MMAKKRGSKMKKLVMLLLLMVMTTQVYAEPEVVQLTGDICVSPWKAYRAYFSTVINLPNAAELLTAKIAELFGGCELY